MLLTVSRETPWPGGRDLHLHTTERRFNGDDEGAKQVRGAEACAGRHAKPVYQHIEHFGCVLGEDDFTFHGMGPPSGLR